MTHQDQSPQELPVHVTSSATKRIAAILKAEPDGSMFRVSVKGGGCSGFQYIFEIDQSRNADDLVIAQDGVTVLIDSTALPLVSGSEIDFVDDLMGQSFRVQNPNATASCGCGTSFSL